MSVFSWWSNWLQERVGGSYDPRSRARIEEEEAEARAARAEKQPHMLWWRAQERYEAARADYFKGSPGELEGRSMTQRESLEWEMGKTRSAIQAAMEHEIEGFVDRGVDADVARRLVRGGGGNDKGAVFQLSHDYHVLERRLAALDAAEAAGAEPAQQVDAYDVLEADVSEMSPEARAEFLSANSGEAEEIRSRLSDPSHSPVVGPKANVSGVVREVAQADGGGDPMSWRRARGIWQYETPAEIARDQRWAEKAWEAELAERAERAERAGVVAEGARAWEPVAVESTAADEPMVVDRGPLTAAEEALALEFMLDEPTRDEEKAEMREQFAQWNGVEAEAQSEPDVVVPDPEPEQGTEAPKVAEEAAPLGPEVPLVMGETLRGWEAREDALAEAQKAAAEVATPAAEPEAPVAMAEAPEAQGLETLETYDGSYMTPDPAEVAKKAQQTFESDQMKAEQARRARKQETDPPSREPEPPHQEPQI